MTSILLVFARILILAGLVTGFFLPYMFLLIGIGVLLLLFSGAIMDGEKQQGYQEGDDPPKLD